MRGGQHLHQDRQGILQPRRQRLPDAHDEESAAAGPEAVQVTHDAFRGHRIGHREDSAMRSLIGAIALSAGLLATLTGAQAFDESKYPNWKGMWDRGGIPPRWVPAGQKPPLTPEYQALFDKNTADQKAGGHGMEPSWMCLPPRMPRIMNLFEPMEIIITPA